MPNQTLPNENGQRNCPKCPEGQKSPKSRGFCGLEFGQGETVLIHPNYPAGSGDLSCRWNIDRSVHVRDAPVQAIQETDQDLALGGGQVAQQASLALEREFQDATMQAPALVVERIDQAAAIGVMGPRLDQSLVLQHDQGPADGGLVEADHLAHASGGNPWLDREHGHDAPLGGADAEMPTQDGRRSAGQLVGEEDQQGRHVTLEIEHRPRPPAPG
jgi:hypothetical protein